jgi:ATP diphosphatase
VRATNRKFERRFAAIERALEDRGKTPQDATLEEMDALWNEAKAAERS